MRFNWFRVIERKKIHRFSLGDHDASSHAIHFQGFAIFHRYMEHMFESIFLQFGFHATNDVIIYALQRILNILKSQLRLNVYDWFPFRMLVSSNIVSFVEKIECNTYDWLTFINFEKQFVRWKRKMSSYFRTLLFRYHSCRIQLDVEISR